MKNQNKLKADKTVSKAKTWQKIIDQTPEEVNDGLSAHQILMAMMMMRVGVNSWLLLEMFSTTKCLHPETSAWCKVTVNSVAAVVGQR